MILSNCDFDWIKYLPPGWKLTKVKHQFFFSEIETNDFNSYPVLSLTMSGVIERNSESNEGQIPESYEKYNLVDPSCLVFNPMDLISGWVDVPNITGLISPSYRAIKLNSENLDLHFIKYYFQSLYREKILFHYGEGVHYEYRWGLGKETLKNFPIPQPPIDEQVEIVSFLDKKTKTIDDLLVKINQKIDLLEEQKKIQIIDVITKGLNQNIEKKDSGIKWIGKIPKHWELIRLKYLFSIEGGKDPKNIQDDQGQYPILGTGGEINKGSEFLYDKPTLLLGRKGTIDKPYLFNTPFWVSDVMYYTIQKRDVSPKYLNFLFKIIPFKRYCYGSAKPSMRRLDYENMFFPIPPINERKAIMDYIDEKISLFDKKILIEEKRIKLLKEYRLSIISEIITGKKRVVS